MTRLLFVLLAGLALTACRTEPTDPAAPEDAPAAEVDVDAKAESDPFGEPERVEGAASATQTVTLNEAMMQGGQCYVLATAETGDTMLMGTQEACTQAAPLAGQRVTITVEDAQLDVPEAGVQAVSLVTAVEAAE
ncbi:MAG TPA: hypothetical protein EYQ24_12765 [Bacteroidetes bacterium]|nr:hypothetical protein [Bacteroidota bacterium]HIL57207.1 hypothetical protein [Rhodothermales bacterium]